MIVVPNPEIVQTEDWRNPHSPPESTPVFLIHDGGGTTFAYHCLSPLQRLTYGIHNPYFRSGQVFNGGIPQMARLYASWIKRTVAAKDFPFCRRNKDGTVGVLLGGWSLGGFLSLEIARRLVDDPVVRVVGILMVDSVYPGWEAEYVKEDLAWVTTPPTITTTSTTTTTTTTDLHLEGRSGEGGGGGECTKKSGAGEGDDDADGDDDVDGDDDDGDDDDDQTSAAGSAREKNLVLSRRCLANAIQMVSRWNVPRWDGALAGRRPRAILLRAKQAVPTPDGKPVSGLDRHRGERRLGWDAYAEDIFEEVVDVEGHHFELFAPQWIEGISDSMRRALDKLDAMAKD